MSIRDEVIVNQQNEISRLKKLLESNMIPVTQTKVVVKNNHGKIVVEGNCYAAIIASLLGVPITEVPNVEVFFDDEEKMFYETLMKRYLKNKGLKLVKDNRFKIAFHCDQHEDRNVFRKLLWDKYYIATGDSPRGFCHVCIFKNGELVHDPHPSRDGISEPYEFEVIEPIVLPNDKRSVATEDQSGNKKPET